jgi:hypothetical protein
LKLDRFNSSRQRYATQLLVIIKTTCFKINKKMEVPEAQAAPAAAPAQVAVIDKEKIPLFHADAKQDSFQAEYWIQRLG